MSHDAASPSPILQRPLSVDDLQALARGEVPAGLPTLAGPSAMPPPFVLQRAAARIAAGEPAGWWAPFLVVRRSDGLAVGGCAFKGAPEAGRVEILYGVARECRRQGVAAHAVRALVRLAFERGVACVRAEVDDDNEGSIRTVQACGFRPAGERVAVEEGTRVLRFEITRDATAD